MYSVRLLSDAVKELKSLDKVTASRIVRKLQWLADNIGTVKPKWLRGDLSSLATLREGSYRIIYQPVDSEKLIIVHSVGHRSEVYKRR